MTLQSSAGWEGLENLNSVWINVWAWEPGCEGGGGEGKVGGLHGPHRKGPAPSKGEKSYAMKAKHVADCSNYEPLQARQGEVYPMSSIVRFVSAE